MLVQHVYLCYCTQLTKKIHITFQLVSVIQKIYPLATICMRFNSNVFYTSVLLKPNAPLREG